MEEKQRYEYFFGTNTVKDNINKEFLSYKRVIDTLNQQDKRIKELEEDQALLTMLISGIDNLMHDKDYRFKNDNGTWYSRQSCKDLTSEEVYQEIIDEINQLDSNFEILDKENQQLRQSQKQLAIKELEELQKEFDYCPYSGDKIYVAEVYDKIFAKIQELGGGENVKN